MDDRIFNRRRFALLGCLCVAISGCGQAPPPAAVPQPRPLVKRPQAGRSAADKPSIVDPGGTLTSTPRELMVKKPNESSASSQPSPSQTAVSMPATGTPTTGTPTTGASATSEVPFASLDPLVQATLLGGSMPAAPPGSSGSVADAARSPVMAAQPEQLLTTARASVATPRLTTTFSQLDEAMSASMDVVIKLLENQKWDEAIDAAEKLQYENPDNPLVYDALARAYIGKSEFIRALPNLDRVIKLVDDKPAVLYFNRGFVRYQLQQYLQAIEDLNMAVQKDPQFMPAFFWRGIAMAQEGRFDDAIDDMDKVLVAFPDTSEALYVRCVAYLESRRPRRVDLAKADFQAAVRTGLTGPRKEQLERIFSPGSAP